MFKMRGDGATVRNNRISIRKQTNIFGAINDKHRLKRKNHARLNEWPLTLVAIVRNVRLLMNLVPNSVTAKFAHIAKLVLLLPLFNYNKNITNTLPHSY